MGLVKTRQTPDFNRLWGVMISETERIGHDRMKSVLLNHSGKKEYICRKLGIVTISDIERIISTIETKKRRSVGQ